MRYFDDVATGEIERPQLFIAGRPKPNGKECFVILEEPTKPVQCHYKPGKGNVPHWSSGECPNCKDCSAELRPLWYVGASHVFSALKPGEDCILELWQKCFDTAQVGARVVPVIDNGVRLLGDALVSKPSFIGLYVTITRGAGDGSKRLLRFDVRRQTARPWKYDTRHELAHIWGVPVRPRLGVFRGQHG